MFKCSLKVYQFFLVSKSKNFAIDEQRILVKNLKDCIALIPTKIQECRTISGTLFDEMD